MATYSATKFALRALTEALELEWRRYGIRVLAVWPLFVQTAMTDGVETGSTKTLGIHLKPEDVAKAVYSATHSGRRWLTRVHYPVGRLTGISQRTPGWAQRLITKTVTRSQPIELEACAAAAGSAGTTGIRPGCRVCRSPR